MKIFVDEAGRGPLAGPVYVGLVADVSMIEVLGVDDSKKLSDKMRRICFQQIVNKNLWSFGKSTAQEIDKYGIIQAIHTAILRGLLMMGEKIMGKKIIQKKLIEFFERYDINLCIDGNHTFGIDKKRSIPCETIIDGDALISGISMASIVAKVLRDDEMIEWGKKYSLYGFENHKGYGTKKHYENMRLYGLLDIHRQSYLSSFKQSLFG